MPTFFFRVREGKKKITEQREPKQGHLIEASGSVSRQLSSVLAANCAFRRAQPHMNNTERKRSCDEVGHPRPNISQA